MGSFGVLSVIPSNTSTTPFDARVDPTDAAEQLALVKAQIERLFGDSVSVPIETRAGYPPAVISAYADTHESALLIVGIGRPRVLDRLSGDESALRLVRLSRTPVLVVAEGRATPPRRVIVGMDFTPTSVEAATLARELAAPDAGIVLAHVGTPDGRAMPELGMRRMVETLQTGFCGRITSRMLRGDPATELLSLASEWSADALAIGMHGHGALDRVAIGPVAMRVVRCANCSVIVTPRARVRANPDG